MPETVEAKSLVPLLDGRQETVRRAACAVYKDVQRAVVEDRWKLIRSYYYCRGAR